MKRLCILGVLFLLLTGCGQQTGASGETVSSGETVLYQNPVYGYTLSIPATWEYTVTESATCAEFRMAGGTEGTLFSIVYMDAGKNENLPAGELLGVCGETAIYDALPTDVQYDPDDAADAKKYTEMSGQVAEVLKSFALPREIAKHSMCYLSDVTAESAALDPIEWLTAEDTDRLTELGVTEEEMPDGYLIVNDDQTAQKVQFAPNIVLTVLNWQGNYEQMAVTPEQFAELFAQRMRDYGTQGRLTIPFHAVIDNDKIVAISEQYIP